MSGKQCSPWVLGPAVSNRGLCCLLRSVSQNTTSKYNNYTSIAKFITRSSFPITIFYYREDLWTSASQTIKCVPARENVPSGHVPIGKAQIRLRRCAVWSGPSLSANRIIRILHNVSSESKGPDVQDDLNLRILYMFERHFFAWSGPNNVQDYFHTGFPYNFLFLWYSAKVTSVWPGNLDLQSSGINICQSEQLCISLLVTEKWSQQKP